MSVTFQANLPVGAAKPAAPLSRAVLTSARPLQAPAPVTELTFSGSAKRQHILLPEGTPVFLLHGTSNNGNHMTSVAHWLQRDVASRHPHYVAELPEVDFATGIETVAKPKKHTPSSLTVVRDLGDFRYQVVNNRLRSLDAQLGQAADMSDQNDAKLAEVFHIRPDEQALLLPLIREHILKPLDQVPSNWHKANSLPLRRRLAVGLGKLNRELDKCQLTPEEKKAPYHDAHFLNTRAKKAGLKPEFSMSGLSGKPDAMSVRPITLEDVSLLEGYLFNMEKDLAAALAVAYRQRCEQTGRRFGPEDTRRGDKTAARLMSVLAPKVMAVGHSQGATVLTSALMNAIQTIPAPGIQNRDPREFPYLGARSIGVETALSGVLTGLPDEPAWGKLLMSELNEVQSKIPLLRRKEGSFGKLVRDLIWLRRTSNEPAVAEMRAGSPLMQKISSQVDSLKDAGVTVLSVYNPDDGYVGPEDSQLRNPQGEHPPNVFHLQVQTGMMAPFHDKPDALLRSFNRMVPLLGTLGLYVLPYRVKKAIHKVFNERISPSHGLSADQHRSTYVHPAKVSTQVGSHLVKTLENQVRLLDTHNFEPMRYQALVVMARRLDGALKSQPLSEAAATLKQYVSGHPQVLDALFDNIREDVPLTCSASYMASEVVSRSLALMEKILDDPALRVQYRTDLLDSLRAIRNADLPPGDPAQTGLSIQAARLLHRLGAG